MNPFLLTCGHTHLSQEVIGDALIVVAAGRVIIAIKTRYPLDSMKFFIVVEANFVAAEASSASSVRASSVSACNLIIDVPFVKDEGRIEGLIAQTDPLFQLSRVFGCHDNAIGGQV